MPHILIVEDNANVYAALGELVGAEGFTTALAGPLRDTCIQMSRHNPDAMLIDFVLPDGSGMDLMEDTPSHSDTGIIAMAGHASVETAVGALHMRAADYLVKPVSFQRLKSVLTRIPRPGDLKAEIGNLCDELRRLGLSGQMLGNSTAIQALYDQVSRVVPIEMTVLLIDESGIGKELAIQTVHDLSLRHKQPFLLVNCGAISPNLIEPEILGHERGSFTGANRRRKGYFERASGGTLFLGGITEMPIELQVKLLRVPETGMFMHVGVNREAGPDMHMTVITNRSPEETVADDKLRTDLYHRLNVSSLQLPPLRERGKDVELLAQHFFDRLSAQSNTRETFLPPVMETPHGYHWPGNAYELRSYAQCAHILSDEASIDTTNMSLWVSNTQTSPGSMLTIPVGIPPASTDEEIILITLGRYGGMKKRAAESLGTSPKTLYNRLEEYSNSSAEDVGEGNSTSNSAGSGRVRATEA